MSEEKKPTRPATLPMGKKPSLPTGKKPSLPMGKKPAIGRIVEKGNMGGLTRKDFASDQDVRWCPGCGDYSILAQTQRIMPEIVEKKENVVFISGIGCSSRFPYYMNTYGMHSIHGRAPAFASGLKSSRPELDVWIITGDGDSLSIGGNHLLHLMRRNLNCQILLFNNQIYGLTKGQYSPTSEIGKITKSTPYGSLDHPLVPAKVVLGADATFVARTMDRDPKHLQTMLKEAHQHPGTGFVEIYQNCNIFNDGAFFDFTEAATKPLHTLFVEHGKPMVYDNGKKGLKLDGFKPISVDLTDGNHSADDCLVHDETSRELAFILANIFWQPNLPRPFGVFYREERPSYDQLIQEQMETVRAKRGKGDIDTLLRDAEVWTVE